MRLICPRCGAQYEIDGAAIPPAGRDVECSACDHVWRAMPAPESFDPAARPQLSRPLSESVIEILREEAARELEVRAAERRALRAAERAAAPPEISPAEAPRAAPEDRPDEPAEAGAADLDPAAGAEGGGLPPEAPAPARPDMAPPPETTDPGAAGDAALEATPTVVSVRPVPQAGPAAPPPTPPQEPPSRRADAGRARRRHDAGFRLAVIVAVVAVVLYALAPRLSGLGPAGERIADWRAQVDQGRDWLARQGEAAIAGLRPAGTGD